MILYCIPYICMFFYGTQYINDSLLYSQDLYFMQTNATVSNTPHGTTTTTTGRKRNPLIGGLDMVIIGDRSQVVGV